MYRSSRSTRSGLEICGSTLRVVSAGRFAPSRPPLRLLLPLSFLLLLLPLFLPSYTALADDRAPVGGVANEIDFARDIRPLLSDRCFLCHGPDAGQRASDLRLDMQSSAHQLAIEPGDAAGSELMRRITSDDADELMPPPDSNLKLKAGEQELLRRWIDQGGEYEQHWAFVAQVRPAAPEVKQTAWPRSDLDRFVLKRLEQEQLSASPPADAVTLIRRLSLDLTGLPPTLAELDAFVADYAEQPEAAYERLVDRLLSSERYGERMAVDWLDVARYADTYGYQADRYRAMWPWRDWVVQAFNQNLGYDDFITWQLAGDLLPDATREQILATAFNRNHRQTNEGGSVEEEFRSEYVADRVNTLGAAFLGLTLECCRCHDHKYDPITQREYYQFSSFFNSIDESGLYSHFTEATPTPTLLLADDRQAAELASVLAEIDTAQADLAQWQPSAAEFAQWSSRLPDIRQTIAIPHTSPTTGEAEPSSADAKLPTENQPIATNETLQTQLERALAESLVGDFSLDKLEEGKLFNRVDQTWAGTTSDGPDAVAGRVGQGLRLSGDNTVSLKTGSDFTRDQPFTISLWLKAAERFDRAVIFHRSQAWTDSGSRGYELLIEDGKLSAGLIHFWPGNALRVVSTEELPLDRWVQVAVRYDGSSQAEGLSLFIDGQRVATDVVRDCLTKHIIGHDAAAAIDLSFGQRFRDRGFKNGEIDELKVFTRDLSDLELKASYLRDAAPENLVEVLHNASQDALQDFFSRRHPQRIGQEAALRQLRERRSQLSSAITEIMVMREQPTERPTFVLLRGAYDAPREQVERALPASILPTKLGAQASRVDLARWLVDPQHPLTARVAVNRFWQALFGQGLVSTAEDFGLQGAAPSHPELLDWLSVEFVESGWDVKRLLKTIVMSATYRQTSNTTPALLERDPENRLLARGPSGRLPAEMIRDCALAASGLLVETVGGAPVKPYQPEGLWEEKSGQKYERDTQAGSHRRSLYTYWKRTSPPPSMMTLDASNREVCVVHRQVTMTPLQTLVLLNDPQYVEAARGLAQRAMQTSMNESSASRRGASSHIEAQRAMEARPDESAIAAFIFRSLTARVPSDAELSVLLNMFQVQKELMATDPAGREQWLSIGDHQPAQDIDPLGLAAWSAVASGLMSFDETVMKR